MRSIQVSVPVFAAIWSNRMEGEESEDAILARILNADREPSREINEKASSGGVYVERFDVHFSEGFEIYRNYKGTIFKATAVGNRWLLENDGRTYPSLHKLSWAVVAGRENAWSNWKYKDDRGKEHLIDHLRPQGRIQRRIS